MGIASLSYDPFVLAKAKELGIGVLRLEGNTITELPGKIKAY
ncbi:hypothetical protein AGMMS49938_03970 [Fibrobacterales bacterium]|nr:hypothetical protein AGMMS49938_03970 [Fibrobacterales bacterium]